MTKIDFTELHHIPPPTFACEGLKIDIPPEPIGSLYLIDNFSIPIFKKPSWFHRKMVEWILGFKYEFEPTK